MIIKLNTALAVIPFCVTPFLRTKRSADHLIVSATSNNLSPCGFCPISFRVFDQWLEAGSFRGCVGS